MPVPPEGRVRAACALRWAPALAVLGWLGLPAPAWADDTEPIRIALHAPTGCPDEAAFAGQVTARTGRARLAGTGEAARTFTVTITADGAKVRGKLVIDDPKGPPTSRALSGGTCDEVVSALGLIAALAIDPHASTAPTPLPPPPPPRPPPAPPPKPREPLPPPPRYTAIPWWGPIGEPLPAIPAPPAPPRWRVGWALHAGGASATAPRLSLVLGGFVEAARVLPPGGGVLAPAFRLGLLKAYGGAVPAGPAEEARFALIAARAQGCPVRIEALPSLAAYPCVLLDAGATETGGTARVASVPSTTRPWVAPGTGARVQWTIAGLVALEVEGGVNFPLVRDTFYFARDTTAHAVPVAGGYFSGGLGTHFP